MTVLAVCEGPAPGEQATAVVFAVLLPLAYVLLMLAVFRGPGRLRDLVVVYLVGLAAGAIALTQPDSDPSVDYLKQFLVAAAIVAAAAAWTATWRGGEVWRYTLAGVLGASAFGAFALWVVTMIGATGSCID